MIYKHQKQPVRLYEGKDGSNTLTETYPVYLSMKFSINFSFVETYNNQRNEVVEKEIVILTPTVLRLRQSLTIQTSCHVRDFIDRKSSKYGTNVFGCCLTSGGTRRDDKSVNLRQNKYSIYLSFVEILLKRVKRRGDSKCPIPFGAISKRWELSCTGSHRHDSFVRIPD